MYVDKVFFCFGKNFEFPLEDFDETGSVVDILDVNEAGLSDRSPVLFDRQQIVPALLDICSKDFRLTSERKPFL